LVGAASSAGARQVGQERAPALLRQAGIVDALRLEGVEVSDLGDIGPSEFRPDPFNRHQQNLQSVVSVVQDIAERVSEAVSVGAFPVVLGGDCTVTLGAVAGIRRNTGRSLGLIYFDGDVDLHTPETTESGIFDGMGMAHIIGLADNELAAFATGTRPLMAARDVVLFGFDEEWVDSAEQRQLVESDLTAFSCAEVLPEPVRAAEHARAAAEAQNETYLLHFDVDVIAYEELPVADVPHFNGMPLAAALASLAVFCTGPVAGFVLTEYNAARDTDGVIAASFVRKLVPLLTSAATHHESTRCNPRRSRKT
jgi:arginase